MAPEVLLRQNHSFCADFYAVGVIAYELLVSKRPYVGRDRKSIREEMLGREAKVPTNFAGKISKEGADFINRVSLRVFSCFRGQPGSGWATTEYPKSSTIPGSTSKATNALSSFRGRFPAQ